MGLPAADGLAVLYVLCREWMAGLDMLAALGVAEPDRLDGLLGLDGGAAAGGGRAGRRLRVAAMGGELG